ncbi:KRAB-A domain-containing protein 2 [Trichonephila clavipes]|nr:KRAB-A domain-containing protein 2 [Trichonephila clavipes]
MKAIEPAAVASSLEDSTGLDCDIEELRLICSGGGRKQRSRQRWDRLFPSESFVLLGVRQLCQSYSGRERESSTASNKNATNHTKKFAPAQIGDIERIEVPDVIRGRTDNQNELAVVVGIEDFDFYKLANDNSFLKQLYTRNQCVICKERLLSIDEIYFQEMSLREAAAANSRSGGQGYTCYHCKRKCSTNKSSCKSMGFLCNPKCHINSSCCNK